LNLYVQQTLQQVLIALQWYNNCERKML